MRRRALFLGGLAALALLAAAGALAIRHLRQPVDNDGAVQTVISTPSQAETAPSAPSQPPPSGEVTLTVRDRMDEDALQGARVQVRGGRSQSTGADGAVVLRRPRRGQVVVDVTAPGFEPLRQVVTFTPGRAAATVWLWRPEWSWPLYGATPERTMAQEGIELRPPLETRWGLKFDGMLEFPPVTANGVAYVASAIGTLTAFRTEDGAWVWRRRLGEHMASSPAVADGRVFLATWKGAGQLRAFSAFDGRLLWQRALGSASESSPLVLGKRVFTASVDGRVHAYSAVSGRRLWESRPGGKLTGAVARWRGNLIVGDYDGRVHALRAADGALVWSTAIGGQIYATPSVSQGRVFVTSSTEKTLSALAARNGAVLWQRPLDNWAYPAAAVADGIVATASYGAVLRAFRASDGRPLWSARLGERVYGAPQIVAGVVWVSSFNSRTHAYDLHTGRLLQRFPMGRYVPISGDARTLLLIGYSRIWGLRPPAA